jgi:hypothetical protein
MDTVWPLTIHNRFATIPANPRENDYYAPYNKLLNFLFTVDGPFAVGPLTHRIAEAETKCRTRSYNKLREIL